MRPLVDADRARRFMEALASELHGETCVYLMGGTSAVVSGWRASTVDVDLKLVPDVEAPKVLPRIKASLQINVDVPSLDRAFPEVPQWETRSRFIASKGAVTFLHYDFYSQALAKLERGFDQDLEDVREMVARGLVDPKLALELYETIEPELGRYPAIDPPSFRRAVEKAFAATS
jgi:uncharacterized nucleotidyltransferase DUF6036